jgi:hypothetical protein
MYAILGQSLGTKKGTRFDSNPHCGVATYGSYFLTLNFFKSHEG